MNLILGDHKELMLNLLVVIMALCFGKKMPMCLVLHTEAYMGKTRGCLKFAENTPGELFPADSALANMVSVPETHGTFCKSVASINPTR